MIQMSTTFYVLASHTDTDDMADAKIQPTAYQTERSAKKALNHLAQAHLTDYQKNPNYADAEIETNQDLDIAEDMLEIIDPDNGLIETLWLTKITNIN